MEEVSSVPPPRPFQDVCCSSPNGLLSSWGGPCNQVAPYLLNGPLGATVQPSSDLLSPPDCTRGACPTAPPGGTVLLHFIFFKCICAWEPEEAES